MNISYIVGDKVWLSSKKKIPLIEYLESYIIKCLKLLRLLGIKRFLLSCSYYNL